MKNLKIYIVLIYTPLCLMQSCTAQHSALKVEVFETSSEGHQLTKLNSSEFKNEPENNSTITLNPEKIYQKILGFGGAFTESSAYLYGELGQKNKEKVLKAYFSEDGANYSLTRTVIGSTDFALTHYSYASDPQDLELKKFSIAHDLEYLIPMIHDAQKISKDNFKIIASPWTAPPFMKDNNSWVDGKLLPKYNKTWALFFEKYLAEYQKKNINIWGLTVENEPNGSGGNWESMQFTPKEMTDFVQNYLGPRLENSPFKNVKILGYDQNRKDLLKWTKEMYRDKESSKYFAGAAIHWYDSTYDYFPDILDQAHADNPDKLIIQTEACVDADIPHWQDDAWYWSKEATDWGFDWAPKEDQHLHPKYVPVYRYVRDIIGCLNHSVSGWIDWNMILNKQGGPNWFKNWCVAPVIVDVEKDEVYFTPIYYVMAQFSKFIRPNAVRIDFKSDNQTLMTTAVKNPNGDIIAIIFNPSEEVQKGKIVLGNKFTNYQISKKALQTIIIKK